MMGPTVNLKDFSAEDEKKFDLEVLAILEKKRQGYIKKASKSSAALTSNTVKPESKSQKVKEHSPQRHMD